MVRTPRDITETELTVLKYLWANEVARVRDIAEALYSGGKSAESTVRKLLERLEEKGHVARREDGGARVYTAITDRAGIVGRRLRDVADELCDGSLDPLLTHLVDADGLTKKDRDTLRALVEKLERKAERARKRR